MEISSILVANRGEIALRVMRTAKAMGLRTIAVYSDADAHSPHVAFADDAVHIGPSPVGESYLVIDKLIAAAKMSGADAIHPGYGFLSENAAFARACKDAGIVFIGPPEHAIRVMGDKALAKREMIKAGVPCVPGYQGENQAEGDLLAVAGDIGFPIMVKAAAGGGGRGMRLVSAAADLAGAIRLARSEAENAFGSGNLILEKAILRPRHVEIQVFADAHGNVIHLGERDCSVQRRHQKVIEEAPCPVMTPDLRRKMGAAAVEAARAVDYRGAGTVEFLLGSDGQFYFLEMNTRLQVEHPVTEEITGLDLVALQIAVARGEPLPVTQDQVVLSGHAIEVRLYAEDPAKDFLPSTGPILKWIPPEGEGIRVDAGIATGGAVSPFYDAMVAKIVARGATRDEARRRLIAALNNTALFGLSTNRDFLIDALSRPVFVKGEATTAFIAETYGEGGFTARPALLEDWAPAIVIGYVRSRQRALDAAVTVSPELLGWSSTQDLRSSAVYALGDQKMAVTVRPTPAGFELTSGKDTVVARVLSLEGSSAVLKVGDKRVAVLFHEEGSGTIHTMAGGTTLSIRNLSSSIQPVHDEAGGRTVTAPMHGRLLEVIVSVGTLVKKGDKLAVLEAMKMQHEIVAAVDGTVCSVFAAANTQIAANDVILEIEPVDGAKT